jgi:hypothetical protein
VALNSNDYGAEKLFLNVSSSNPSICNSLRDVAFTWDLMGVSELMSIYSFCCAQTLEPWNPRILSI